MKPNGRKQRIRLGRLSQYRRHPGILGERRERVGRNHDHWDGSTRLFLTLLGAEVPTIHARHDEVKQDEGGHDLAAPQPPKRLPSACRRDDSVALSFTLEAADLPEDVFALVDAHLLDLGGTYGDPSAGDAVQYPTGYASSTTRATWRSSSTTTPSSSSP